MHRLAYGEYCCGHGNQLPTTCWIPAHLSKHSRPASSACHLQSVIRDQERLLTAVLAALRSSQQVGLGLW